jgi:pyruvate ferredoxin oxidoreductase alpha subunit
MPVVNRSLASPWNLWCDHQDAMAAREMGWMQLYAETPQDVLDLILIAYRASEHADVLLPCMVNIDGFFLSHLTEVVMVPDQDTVDSFLPAYVGRNLLLDPSRPVFVNNLTGPAEFLEMRYQQAVAFERASAVLPEVCVNFEKVFGRQHPLVEFYWCDGAERVLVVMGSMAGTAKYVVDQLRVEGHSVGIVKVVSFRPFFGDLLRQHLAGISRIGVIDRCAGLGGENGPLCTDVKAALPGASVQGFIAGLGGRDIRPETVKSAFEALKSPSHPKSTWLDLGENAMFLREVECPC